MEFECAEGQYISELKYFGFLYAMDLRYNIESFGESFCFSAENPDKEALYLGSTPLGEPPLCTEDEKPEKDNCVTLEEEDETDERRQL